VQEIGIEEPSPIVIEEKDKENKLTKNSYLKTCERKHQNQKTNPYLSN
jgi:hypothetical protein